MCEAPASWSKYTTTTALNTTTPESQTTMAAIHRRLTALNNTALKQLQQLLVVNVLSRD